MIELSIVLFSAFLLAWPLGRYMSGIFSGQTHFSDRVFLPLENLIYRLLGIRIEQGMDWKTYAITFLISNLVLGVFIFILLLVQQDLPMNPDHIGSLPWHTALHTAISFLTNTDQQHYSGQAQLSYFSQSVALVTLMFVTPAMGLAVCVAVLRGLLGGRHADKAQEGDVRDLGNYYVDLVRGIIRLFIPLACILALCLASQGVPSTYRGAQNITVLDSAVSMKEQTLPIGPVAAMIAIKQLGSNGGGWYGPNSAHPMENPTPLSNALQTIAIILMPMAIVFMAGGLLNNKPFGWMSFAAMLLLSATLIASTLYSEHLPNHAFAGLSAIGPNMEGKEVRFSSEMSSLWATLTTQTSNGSVNTMHDSLNPLAGLTTRIGMLMNTIWGGIGCGFVNFMVYVLMAVFLSGLMIGRTPEIFGRKIETQEITLLAALVVLPTLCILSFTAIAIAIPSITGSSNPGFHGISQVFYEYTSAFANNGSGFEGLGDGNAWWNLSTSVCLLLGRYLPLVIPLAIAGSLSSKRVAPESAGTLRLENVTFCLTLVSIIIILNVLSFLPTLVLGPIGEALQLR